MSRNGFRMLAMASIAGLASATHAASDPGVPAQPEVAQGAFVPVGPVPADDRPILVPTTLEYQWIFHVPVVSIEHRRIAITTPIADTQSRRWSYDVPALRDRRFKLWDAPEFSCTYPDVILPNECRTVWHGVYVDLPVLVNQRAHIDVDVPRVRLVESSIQIDIAHWTWKEQSFRFSLPAYAPPEAVERVRSSLYSQRVAVTNATDETLAGIDRQIQSVRASGEDPARLDSGDGATIDLLAQRQALVDERDQELERLAAVDAELSQLPARH